MGDVDTTNLHGPTHGSIVRDGGEGGGESCSGREKCGAEGGKVVRMAVRERGEHGGVEGVPSN
jgi:hypothetical protein